MSSLLEKATNICLIVACAVVVGEYGYRHFRTPVTTHPIFRSGDRIKAKGTVALDSAPRTLIVAVSSTCTYWRASMPSYKQVADAARRGGARVIAISGEPAAVNQEFLASHGIAVDKIVDLADSGIPLATVPSLILVRGDGTVIDSWTGLVDETFQRSAMQALSRN